MNNTRWTFLIFLVCLIFGQTSGMFLQAISAALATIPFTGGPIAMTAGLAGVKLAVGTKLLYFLGRFGGSGRKPPTSFPATKPSQQKLKPPSFPQGYSAVPLPYMFGGGGAAVGQQFGMLPQGFPQGYPQGYQFDDGAGQQFSPSQLMQAYGEMQQSGQSQYLPSGIPEQYSDQGFYPQMDFNAGGGGGGFRPPPLQYETSPEGGNVNSYAEESIQQDVSNEMHQQATSGQTNRPSGTENDVDSFFNFLSEMDDNMCISRLICDIGADPDFLGEFSRNINSIISNLEVPPDTRAHHYLAIMQAGREGRGGCEERFIPCTNDAYEIVKSLAPTVGVPPNLS